MAGEILYIDTNAIRSLKRHQQHYLWQLCEQGKIRICLSNYVVWEVARQRYHSHYEQSEAGAGLFADEEGVQGKILEKMVRGHIIGLKKQGVQIIDNITWLRAASFMAEHDESYFTGVPTNDGRDALITCGVIDNFKPEDVIVVCQEQGKGKLDRLFQLNGFNVSNSLIDLVPELKDAPEKNDFQLLSFTDPDLNTYQFPEDFYTTLNVVDPDYHKLLDEYTKTKLIPVGRKELDGKLEQLGEKDNDIRIRLLGYAYAFSPALSKFVVDNAIKDESQMQLDASLERLLSDGLLIKKGDYLLPNSENEDSEIIGAQSMEIIWDELAEIGGLNE